MSPNISYTICGGQCVSQSKRRPFASLIFGVIVDFRCPLVNDVKLHDNFLQSPAATVANGRR